MIPVDAAPTRDDPVCSDDWQENQRGNCVFETDMFSGQQERYFVHRGGWLVKPSCFERFGRRQFEAALTAAWKKFHPQFGLSQGGCLAHFNPAWGEELLGRIWHKRIVITCQEADGDACARRRPQEGYITDFEGNLRHIPELYNLISIESVEGCMIKGSSGLAGVLFHETLHALGEDNLPRESHNRAWARPQLEFVQDRIYGAEAVCFFGVRPELRRFVNISQCRNIAADEPDDLCDDFDTSYSDSMPPGFLKH